MSKRFGGIAKDILYWLLVSGIVAIAATSPYFGINLMKQMGREYEKKKFANALYRLRKSRTIIFEEKKGGTYVVELTEKGRKKTEKLQYDDLRIQKPKKWDGIWRIVIFDIPNKKKIVRETLRNKMKGWDFYQLQESVWVCPWPCEKEIGIVVELLGIYSFVNMIKAKEIQDDEKLKAHFKLL